MAPPTPSTGPPAESNKNVLAALVAENEAKEKKIEELDREIAKYFKHEGNTRSDVKISQDHLATVVDFMDDGVATARRLATCLKINGLVANSTLQTATTEAYRKKLVEYVAQLDKVAQNVDEEEHAEILAHMREGLEDDIRTLDEKKEDMEKARKEMMRMAALETSSFSDGEAKS
ncbi:uncharacterized protein LTR77_009673 [Saxophila tyrrhenica]|uniref:Uncharacterized protein n=1 Tax=Saxophila tyrrhenica TaxID=1690608 RepID=A0AAV9P0C4_9PEZI|nr:hypothetical protein LTR77_009673 [Saxophila tyrrhenica]